MTSLVEQFASQVGWRIGKNTVVVEGASDVAFLVHASDLHAQQHGRPILDSDFNVVAAGQRDDGGVDGINRRLNACRQLADADRDQFGAIIYRFVGLYDNDRAGRNALSIASRFDRRLAAYVDLFLLHPVMPIGGPSVTDLGQEVTRINRQFAGLDWEIEDLCSERLLAAFESGNPRSVTGRRTAAGRTHREFNRGAKPELRRYFLQYADIGDAREMLALLKALRSYVGIDHSFIRQ
jgi:hypothetical protein